MAKLYRRKGSKFMWVRYRDPVTGKQVRMSTRIDPDMPGTRKKQIDELHKWASKEARGESVRTSERWSAWARQYFERRYAATASNKSANYALDDLLTYFAENDVIAPSQVDHFIASGFAPWLTKRRKGRTGKKSKKNETISVNTAKVRTVYLSVLMGEAVRRGFCEHNPCREIEVAREAAKQKLEITDEDQKKIEAALLDQPEWMREQWLVLMKHGCRIAETHIPMERIDTKGMSITFRIKRGGMHVATLHPDLLPLIEKARAEKRSTLLGVENVSSWSPKWCQFFQSFEPPLPYSIHCTRVTVITRLVRAGHPVVQICNFIGHSEEVNRIYRKLKPADSSALLATLGTSATPS